MTTDEDKKQILIHLEMLSELHPEIACSLIGRLDPEEQDNFEIRLKIGEIIARSEDALEELALQPEAVKQLTTDIVEAAASSTNKILMTQSRLLLGTLLESPLRRMVIVSLKACLNHVVFGPSSRGLLKIISRADKVGISNPFSLDPKELRNRLVGQEAA